MNKQITAKTWREDFHKSKKEESDVIDGVFESLWQIAAELQTVCKEPIRITTQFGDFTFYPKQLF